MANVLSLLGEKDEAWRHLDAVLRLDQQSARASADDRIASQINAGFVKRDSDIESARRHANGALELIGTMLSNDPMRQARAYSDVSGLLYSFRDYSEAHALLRTATELVEQRIDPRHPELVNYYANLAVLEKELGLKTQALTTINRAVSLAESAYEPTNPPLAEVYKNAMHIAEFAGDVASVKRFGERMRSALLQWANSEGRGEIPF